MEELLEIGQGLQLNPYVVQIEKLSESLQYLSQAFKRKTMKQYRCDEIDVKKIAGQVANTVCYRCEGKDCCQMMCGKVDSEQEGLRKMIRELVQELEEYGMELSVSKRREWTNKCVGFELLKKRVESEFGAFKNENVWEGRMVKSKEASLVIMQALVKAMEETTKEIDASIFQDEHLERKLANQLRRVGVRPLKIMIFVSKQGQYQIQISAKAKQGFCITTKQVADIVSRAVGRRFVPEKKERIVVKDNYDTMVFVEKPKYQILHGISKRTKEDSEVSGDNFHVLEMTGGKLYGIISDGMGSGRVAYQESKVILELIEILVEAGVPEMLALEMINAVLVTESKEVEFATLDMCVVDSYRGKIELLKAGAASTYIVTKDGCSIYDASSLPMGVVSDLEVNRYWMNIDKDCYVIMMTDGVTECIPQVDRETFMVKMIRDSATRNPKEIAENILEKTLEIQCGQAKDDMMVMVLGIWELQF